MRIEPGTSVLVTEKQAVIALKEYRGELSNTLYVAEAAIGVFYCFCEHAGEIMALCTFNGFLNGCIWMNVDELEFLGAL